MTRLRGVIVVGITALVVAAPAAARTLLDGTPPTVTVPAAITQDAESAAGASVSFTASASDSDGNPLDVTCSPASGSIFPLGTTSVTCSATDAGGTPGSNSFNVNVEDLTPPTLNLPGTMTAEATSLTANAVSYAASASDAVGVTSFNCAPGSGSNFPLGMTTVNCTAQDAAGHSTNGSFVVNVVDTTGPALSGGPPTDIVAPTESPTGKSIHFDPPTATDLQGTVPVSCAPAPDTNFVVGTTPVTCSASDGRGNSTSQSFNVTVTLVDTTAPVLSGVPSDIAQNTEVAAGKIVSFSTPTATDNIDGSIPVICTKNSGDLFLVGTTTVTCSATDAHGNTASGTFHVTITLVDVTKPTLSGVPGNISDTTESTGGKAVTFTPPTASDNLDGPLGVTCDHAPGSTFPLGTTTVTCSATDAHGNKQQASFTVTLTLIDVTAPVLTGVPSDRFVEANGPTGAIVTFATPSAVDSLDGPIALVGCNPASGTLFSLGTHLVTCSATDAHSNVGSASFQISVVDTTPPTLAIPGPTTVYATEPTGIPETAQAFIAFRRAASADDIVDPNPQITDNLGSFAEVGTQDVGFVARDASGNFTAKSTTLTVLPMPPAGTKPLPLPPPAKLPADVPSLQVITGSGFVKLVWKTVPGAAQYLVYRSQNGARRLADGHGDLIYKGTATTFTDRGLTNGIEYRYVLVVEDAAGNQSAGVAAAGVPRLNLLRTPKDGAKLKKAPKLVWSRNAEADYYNVQVFRGQAKILSTWPVKSSFQLNRTWKYEGKKYTLGKGVYRWYVWPGFGARSAVDYGDLLGSNSFEMLR